MFKLAEDFDENAPLTLCALAKKPSEKNVVLIGTDMWAGEWEVREKDRTIFMRETTYKMRKMYVDGAQIDIIQTLGCHKKSIFVTGTDKDGDLFWEVSFKLDDFNTLYFHDPRKALKEKS